MKLCCIRKYEIWELYFIVIIIKMFLVSWRQQTKSNQKQLVSTFWIVQNKLETETSIISAFKDPAASYDFNSNDADPAPRATWNDENRLVIVKLKGL